MIGEQGALTAGQAAVVGFATAGGAARGAPRGITHRDVKPANVLVADDGRVKLTDFGIARNAADAPMTSVGLVLGSPAYIAPEVAAGQPVTPAADLWGLGATLFAAVEGRPPYDVHGDPVSTITEVVDGEVPRPRRLEPGRRRHRRADGQGSRAPDAARARSAQRLRPLIDDPDDPLYPGSPDAPTHRRGRRPRSIPSARRHRAPGRGHPPTGLAVTARPVARPRRGATSPGPARAGYAATRRRPGRPGPHGPARAGVVVRRPGHDVAGAAGLIVRAPRSCCAGRRAGGRSRARLAGQSPLTTVTVATDRTGCGRTRTSWASPPRCRGLDRYAEPRRTAR